MKNFKKTSAILAMILLAPQMAHAALEPTVKDAQPAEKPTALSKTLNPDFPDIPRNHWAYVALEKLNQANISRWYSGNNLMPLPRVMTRYEFAVGTARAMDKLDMVPPVDMLNLADMSWTQIEHEMIARMWLSQFDDSINALQAEFANELARLGVRAHSIETRNPRSRSMKNE